MIMLLRWALNLDYFSDTWPLEIEIHRLNLIAAGAAADTDTDDDAISNPTLYY